MSLVTRDILVWREPNDSLASLKSRIEHLFGVDIRLSPSSSSSSSRRSSGIVSRGGGGAVEEESSGGNEWIKVLGSEDACYKTQQYVLATYRPDVSIVVPCGIQFANLLFNGSPRLRDAIEKEHQTLLLPAPNGILVQGSNHSVKLTITKLNHLMETATVPLNGQYTIWERNGGTHPAAPNRGVASCPPPPPSSSKELDQQLSQLIKNPQADIPDSLKKALLEKLQSPSKTPTAETTNDPSPSMPKLSQRVKQFVELGYPQDKVEMVVGSLGEDASDNDIMARLVAIHRPSSTASNNSTGPSSNNPTNSSTGTKSDHHSSSLVAPSPSHHSTGMQSREGLRPIVIDGSNIAMSHGKGTIFSCRGIGIAVNWFRQRGHTEITVFVPSWRKEPSKPETPIAEQEILFDLAKSGLVHYTPSRRVRDKKIVCYDDRFIVSLAAERGGVIVSNDHFRDLLSENIPLMTDAIENRLLMYTFVDDTFMVPADPLGKHGPHLDEFLRFESSGKGSHSSEGSSSEHQVPRDKQPCPYKERCNFGPKCRYYHPEKEGVVKSSPSEETTSVGSPSLINEISPAPRSGSSPNKLHPFIDSNSGRGGERQMVYCPGSSLEHCDTFSPQINPPFVPPTNIPHDVQWAGSRRIPAMNKVIPRGSGEVAYAPPKPHPHQYMQQRLIRPEYYQMATPTNQYYQPPDHFIDHTHHIHGIETTPLPRRVPPTTGPPRPHSAQHVGGTYYYETPPTHRHHRFPHDHTQSVYDRALQCLPNEREKIKTILFQNPNIDLQTLLQYVKR